MNESFREHAIEVDSEHCHSHLQVTAALAVLVMGMSWMRLEWRLRMPSFGVVEDVEAFTSSLRGMIAIRTLPESGRV